MENPSTDLPPGDDSYIVMIRHGLARAIQIHSEDFRSKNPEISLDLDLIDDENLLPDILSLAFFRVYQEAMSNIERHAKAGTVRVRYFPYGDAIVLEIQDDGHGFSIPADWARFTSHRAGVMGMKPRIEGLGGQLEITSGTGGGTKIRASLPLPPEHAPDTDPST